MNPLMKLLPFDSTPTPTDKPIPKAELEAQLFPPTFPPSTPTDAPYVFERMAENASGLRALADMHRLHTPPEYGEPTAAMLARAADVMERYETFADHYRVRSLGYLYRIRAAMQAGQVAGTETDLDDLKRLITTGEDFHAYKTKPADHPTLPLIEEGGAR